PIYSWFYEDPFHSIFLATTTSISVLSNSLLLFIIFTTSSSNIGPYRYLLAVFAICDIMTSAGHAAFQPVFLKYVHMTSAGFYFFPRKAGIMIFGVSFDTVFCLTFIGTYYQTFLVLAYHFIYRYKNVTNGITSSFTDSWTKRQWILVGLIVYVLYIASFVVIVAVGMTPSPETRALVPAEVMQSYGIDLTDPRTGFTVLAVRRMDRATNSMYWNAESTISIALCLVLFVGTAGVIVYCIYQTNVAIKSADFVLTESTRRMHSQLFRALLIQTTVPCLFSYTPLSLILITGGVTGISLGSFGNVLFLTTAIFPSVDAFFVLFFIIKFRIAVIRLFHLPFKTSRKGSSVE
ncbi:hypothetical protein PENTCL1PPCAC_16007, partial [Pristionchus entomophagus]